MNLKRYQEVIIKPLIDENPITLQILGICSALAVTNNLTVTLVMCIAVISVISFSNLFISLFWQLTKLRRMLIVSKVYFTFNRF